MADIWKKKKKNQLWIQAFCVRTRSQVSLDKLMKIYEWLKDKNHRNTYVQDCSEKVELNYNDIIFANTFSILAYFINCSYYFTQQQHVVTSHVGKSAHGIKLVKNTLGK